MLAAIVKEGTTRPAEQQQQQQPQQQHYDHYQNSCAVPFARSLCGPVTISRGNANVIILHDMIGTSLFFYADTFNEEATSLEG